VNLEIWEPLEDVVHEGALGQAAQPLQLPVRDHQVGGTTRSRHLLDAGGDIWRLDAHEVRAKVDGVVDRLLQIAAAIEGLTVSSRRVDDDRHERAVECSGELRRTADRAD
jgi:hypothetical protein